ncbi:TetR/AcrR family transcriptional regulator [Apilactobacillus micheneri]|uniref:TetR/AcrR family transcriptional regulator n=1 Tax=Apilactobacillus micheneri TaxID=1899430 RepID=A0A9Q8MTD0_9LACO|nr:TetR/AcrR family transcriptional regulator [Apilactobacillus micheneri]TPR26276.1 TetR/AcrR family transcriptional regulator [Apilactobacillus micheneri]TPR27030.1 TetR/AcrR family transcriptional regulator [Apilactobacillus micheneri]TPR27888.1 TetR/AcrR family transcriptional regulator [Apilactobacillus micheneri]TPR31793.1 TetR/AcrR family transcriptional regulator [Apilactobacillus micheneri]TPR32197.1 TetR/AcrR family transcriptional regulator [Apilactobacillus micheneri]
MNARTNDQKKQKATLISNVALNLFQEKPFAEISMNEIAKKSNVAKGTLFNYYKTKENIFMHLLLVGYANFFNRLLSQLNEKQINTIKELKNFLLNSTEDLIQKHFTLIKLNALRGPILENKASRDQTIDGRKDLYFIHEQLSKRIHDLFPKISISQANKIFIIQSSIISGLINLSGLDAFNQEPIKDDFVNFKVNVFDDSIETFSFYLDGLLKDKG